MLMTLDLNDPRALHVQVADAIRRAVASGEMGPGDRLPPAKEIAGALEVNVNTVLRALRELRDEQLLEFRRGRGVSVRARPDMRGALQGRVRELLDEARRYGYRPEDVIELIKESS
ncbi:GntR family transcriptional regulator [Halopolyspora algeriensis]|uniref:GntR family transcriptional regulator n=1 Tax=Halopolyspora algeriensis TaxID=1500506 RepID=A0A368VG91_9ACTN|nr:GntR family transcriptional regulator [Halopolyspora algeriensis]RCW40268.1 GntR family transcriptional regulator [Halopolyspora algeriensis]TQM46251.1 GntR family transcriptional regulator [Halopolyspora algeriensis]